MKISADVIEQDFRPEETKETEGLITIIFKPAPLLYTLPFPPSGLTWETVKTMILTKCNLSPNAEVTISYKDEEDDKVFISSEEEFCEAMRIGKRLNNKLKMVVKEESPEKQEKQDSSEAEKASSYRELESGEFVMADCASSKLYSKQPLAEKSPIKSDTDNPNVMSEPCPPNMPVWVISYINQIKEEITKEVTRKIMHRVTEMLTGVEMAPPVPPHFEEAPPPPPPRVFEGAEGMPAHAGVICDHCEEPIYGVRYKCGNCSDFDLCERCEGLPGIHIDNHIFLKIRHPVFDCIKHKKSSHKKKPLLKHSLYGITDGLMASSVSAAQNAVAAAAVLSGCKHKKEKKMHKLKKLEKCRLHLKNRERHSDNAVVAPSASWDKLSDVLKIETGLDKQPTFQFQSSVLLGAHFVRDETVPDGMKLLPGAKFTKCWRVCNSGGRPWTSDTVLKYVWGSRDLVPHTYEVKVPHIKPGEEGIISVQFIAPHIPGKYQSHWQLFEKNCTFGHRLWCNIEVQPTEIVEPSAPIDLSTSVSYSRSSTLKTEDLMKNRGPLTKQADVEDKQEVSQIAEVLTAVQEEQERGELVERKIPVTSHTATPNNTPFDMTPPKSPEPPSEAPKGAREIPDDVSLIFSSDSKLPEEKDKCPAGTESEDTASVLSLSSSESDAEYIVVPLPPCFNLKVPFVPPSSSLLLSEESSDFVNVTKPKSGSSDESAKPSESYSDMADSDLTVHTDLTKTSNTTPEVVSQETGAPEEAENYDITAVTQVVSQQRQSCADHTGSRSAVQAQASTDYSSSSEISVITSEDSSPTVDATLSQQNVSLQASDSPLQEPRTPSVNSEGDQPQGTSPKQPLSSEPLQPVAQEEGSQSSVGDPPVYSFAPVNNQPNEGVIQVLPEGLVTGALSAAATVYNTARFVISSMQARREQSNPSSPAVERQPEWSQSPPGPTPMWQLVEMGFCDRAVNERLLLKHKGDISAVVNELISMNDNDWFSSRNLAQPGEANMTDSAPLHQNQQHLF